MPHIFQLVGKVNPLGEPLAREHSSPIQQTERLNFHYLPKKEEFRQRAEFFNNFLFLLTPCNNVPSVTGLSRLSKIKISEKADDLKACFFKLR